MDQTAGLAHVIAYSGARAGVLSANERIGGILDDYAFVVAACIDAWEATGSLKYYVAAAAIGESMVTRFYDPVGGAFFDAEVSADGVVLGALSARRKPLQDTPTPAGNPSAAIALLRLEHLSGQTGVREKVEDTLEAFAGIVEHFGLYAGTYGLALEQFLLAPTQVVVIGEGNLARQLEATAMAGFAVNKSVIRLRCDQVSAASLPPVLGATIPELPGIHTVDGAVAVVCRGNVCQPPVGDREGLLAALAG